MSKALNEILRNLPAVGQLVEALSQQHNDGPPPSSTLLAFLCRRVLDRERGRILASKQSQTLATPRSHDELIIAIKAELKAWAQSSTVRVINGTGIILHSGLGRAVIPQEAREAVHRADRYMLLEVERQAGHRRKRDAYCEELLCEITGAEAAIVVNNNAAATMIILNTMAADREVVVSHSQLVEIGGSFRLPDVMEMSGCRLRAVGTTNKSKPSDYADACGEETGALMLVHTSNYRIMGFTDHVDLDEMIRIGQEKQLPVIHDLGSGSLIDLRSHGIGDEPPVQASVKAGADVICFSGDKLVGGPQAGIIVGKKAWIERIRKNPLARAFRIDKTACISLETTLKIYLEPETILERIPTLSMLTASLEVVKNRAEILAQKIQSSGAKSKLKVGIREEFSELGAGTLPTHPIPSFCLTLECATMPANELSRALRENPVAIFSRIKDDQILLDLRTLGDEDFDEIQSCLETLVEAAD